MGVAGDYYYTLCGISANKRFAFVRFKIDPSLADSTAITNENVGSIFLVEGNVTPVISLSSNKVEIMIEPDGYSVYADAVILSQDAGEGWKHSSATLQIADGFTLDDPADEVLPTYPQGTSEFLNGGEL